VIDTTCGCKINMDYTSVIPSGIYNYTTTSLPEKVEVENEG